MNRLEMLLELRKEQPNDAFMLFALAKEYEKGGDADQALSYYLELLSVNPGYVGLYYHLGKLYEQKNTPEKAIATYRSGMEVAKKAGDMHAWAELNGARMQIDEED
jgi:tetratricopeptide (TPR) repeat protein